MCNMKTGNLMMHTLRRKERGEGGGDTFTLCWIFTPTLAVFFHLFFIVHSCKCEIVGLDDAGLHLCFKEMDSSAIFQCFFFFLFFFFVVGCSQMNGWQKL